MNLISVQDQIEEVKKREKIPEQRCGKCLKQPFTAANSGNRKIMWSTHDEHRIQLINGEAPYITTPYVKPWAQHASSYNVAAKDYEVVAKIQKFEHTPNWDYWLIVRAKDNSLDVIHRVSYVYTTEKFGFMMNNEYVDGLKVGDDIKQGQRIKCSDSMDEYDNPEQGKNLITAYLSSTDTEEDGVAISEYASEQLGARLYHKLTFNLNDNDVMLNLYPDPNDKDSYNVMPALNNEIANGILCAIRRQNNSDSLYSLTWNRLKYTTITDTKYTLHGRVIDLDIFVNNPDQFENSPYHKQLKMYYYNKLRYCSEIVNFISQYKQIYGINGQVKMSNALDRLYNTAKKEISKVAHTKNNKEYSGTILQIVCCEDSPMSIADKLSNRYGGKGVVAKIYKNEDMPILEDGTRIDVLMNKATVIGRLCMGQLLELEINARSSIFLDHIVTLQEDVDLVFEMIRDFVKIIAPLYEQTLAYVLDHMSEQNKLDFLESFVEVGVIKFPLRPLMDNVTMDTIGKLDDEFPWIKQRFMYVPLKDSNGNRRYVKSIRPIVAGYEYFIRLKQHAKEKFSVTSVSTVNMKNENSKSKEAKEYKSPFANTPIKFGSMEIEDLTHMGVTNAIIFNFVMGASPTCRKMYEQLYECDPIDVDIELDENATSRSAETVSVYLKEIGKQLIFNRHVIEPTRTPFYIKPEPVKTPFYIKGESVPVPFKIVPNNKDTEIPTVYMDKNGKLINKMPEGELEAKTCVLKYSVGKDGKVNKVWMDNNND